MKIAIVVAASAVALMSGCATTSTPTPADTQASVPIDDNVDYAHIAAVNNAARSQGLLIRWINYPAKKKVAPVGIAPSQADPST